MTGITPPAVSPPYLSPHSPAMCKASPDAASPPSSPIGTPVIRRPPTEEGLARFRDVNIAPTASISVVSVPSPFADPIWGGYTKGGALVSTVDRSAAESGLMVGDTVTRVNRVLVHTAAEASRRLEEATCLTGDQTPIPITIIATSAQARRASLHRNRTARH